MSIFDYLYETDDILIVYAKQMIPYVLNTGFTKIPAAIQINIPQIMTHEYLCLPENDNRRNVRVFGHFAVLSICGLPHH